MSDQQAAHGPTIARMKAEAQDDARIFPDVGHEIFSGIHPLALVARKRMGAFQRLMGIWLSPADRLARLLRLHREAFEAESQGRYQRADFFWSELHDRLRAAWGDMQMWAHALAACGGETGRSRSPEHWRRTILDEIFVDTHVAFYNGRLFDERPLAHDDRAFLHAGYAAKLVRLAGYPENKERHLVLPPARLRQEVLFRQKRWEQARELCREVLGHYPDLREFQKWLTDAHTIPATESLWKGTEEESNRLDAEGLRGAIALLEADCDRFPQIPDLYIAAAELYYLRAIKLANSRQLADALAAARWSQVYLPGSPKAVEIEQLLRSAMENLQKLCATTLAEIRGSGNMGLTPEGETLVMEANRGLLPLESVQQSSRAGEIPVRFAAALKKYEETSHSESPDQFPVHAAPRLANAPPAARELEPLQWWLFSRRDLGPKALVAAATIALTFLTVATVNESSMRNVRVAALEQARLATARGTDDAVIRAAEAYFSVHPRRRDPAHEAEMRDLYARSIARWFAAEGMDVDTEARARLARYNTLTGNVGSKTP